MSNCRRDIHRTVLFVQAALPPLDMDTDRDAYPSLSPKGSRGLNDPRPQSQKGSRGDQGLTVIPTTKGESKSSCIYRSLPSSPSSRRVIRIFLFELTMPIAAMPCYRSDVMSPQRCQVLCRYVVSGAHTSIILCARDAAEEAHRGEGRQEPGGPPQSRQRRAEETQGDCTYGWSKIVLTFYCWTDVVRTVHYSL